MSEKVSRKTTFDLANKKNKFNSMQRNINDLAEKRIDKEISRRIPGDNQLNDFMDDFYFFDKNHNQPATDKNDAIENINGNLRSNNKQRKSDV